MSGSITIERAALDDLREASAKETEATPVAKDPHVVAILPRGEAIRNFVYTGALDEVARHADLSVLSVLPSEELEGLLRDRYPTVIPLRETTEKWFVRAQRDMLDMAHGRWLWSEAARERWKLRDREATTPSLKLRRIAKKLACYPFATRTGLAVLATAERLSNRMLRSSEEYVQLFKKLRPTLVFNGSHIHSRLAEPAVRAAQWLGIPTATFIFSWDNLTSQGRIVPLYDYYFVWNEQIRQQLLSIYYSIKPDQVFVTGTPQFDFYFRPEFHWTRDDFCARVGADPNRPIVLYTTGMANHISGEPKIVEGIADLLREMKTFGPPQLLVREYVKGPTGTFDELKSRRPDIIFPSVLWEREWLTPKPEDSFLLTNMLRHAAVGINVASTISLELCMLDRPVVNIAYRPPGSESKNGGFDYRRYYEFEHYRPVVQSGAVMVARSENEIGEMLHRALRTPEADRDLRAKLVKSMFGKQLDGRAGLRVARQLISIAHKHRSLVSKRSLVSE
jgi:hypothetical protein